MLTWWFRTHDTGIVCDYLLGIFFGQKAGLYMHTLVCSLSDFILWIYGCGCGGCRATGHKFTCCVLRNIM